MMKKNMKTWIYEICRAPERRALPLLSYPGAGLCGIGLKDVVRKADAQYRCVKAVADAFPSAAVMMCMDLSVEAEAFGCEISFSDDDVPAVKKGVLASITQSRLLSVPEVGSSRTFEYIRAAGLLSQNIRERPVFAGMIGPFSLAGRLFDMTEIMISALTEPEATKVLVDKCALFLTRYAAAYKAAGVNGIIIAEPSAGLLSPEQANEFSYNCLNKIISEVQDDDFMVILHNCGNAEKQAGQMVATGASGLHFGNAVDMSRIMPMIPWGRLGMGNIDPAAVIRNSSAPEVRAKTLEVLEKTAVYKNYVLSSGCDIPPGTPAENIHAFFHALECFNSAMYEGETA